MNIKPWPLVKFEGKWSIPHHVLSTVWDKLSESGKDKYFFYDGGILTEDEWIDYVQRPTNFLVLGADTEDQNIVAYGLLTNINDGIAFAHFAFIGAYIPGVVEDMIEFVSKLKDGSGQPLFRVLIGITPRSYDRVIEIIQTWGFTKIGEIPELCNMFYKKRREAGVISYLLLGG